MDVKKLYGRDVDTCKSCSSYKDDSCLKHKKTFFNKDYRICNQWKYSSRNKDQGENVK